MLREREPKNTRYFQYIHDVLRPWKDLSATLRLRVSRRDVSERSRQQATFLTQGLPQRLSLLTT